MLGDMPFLGGPRTCWSFGHLLGSDRFPERTTASNSRKKPKAADSNITMLRLISRRGKAKYCRKRLRARGTRLKRGGLGSHQPRYSTSRRRGCRHDGLRDSTDLREVWGAWEIDVLTQPAYLTQLGRLRTKVVRPTASRNGCTRDIPESWQVHDSQLGPTWASALQPRDGVFITQSVRIRPDGQWWRFQARASTQQCSRSKG